MTTLIDLSKMIRPWYRDVEGVYTSGDHIYRDCEVLAEEGQPREGWGWLDPLGSDVCETCAERYDPDAFEERMANEYE